MNNYNQEKVRLSAIRLSESMFPATQAEKVFIAAGRILKESMPTNEHFIKQIKMIANFN